MSYSEMSDFEINKLVAEALGFGTNNGFGFPDTDGNLVCYDIQCSTGGLVEKRVNYCNSWADMGPIIEGERLTIVPVVFGSIDKQWQISQYSSDVYVYDKNPLRAAAICYLMMKEVSDG